MSKFFLAALIALASGTSFGQMMGGPMSTSQYFPLVDGARYDYKSMSGSWATSTAVMHSGQTWAGATGLTAMHTTYVCNAGVACAPDATDFYRMDPDGMHYFGGTGANSAGNQYSMMSYNSPEWLLKNPVTPGVMMGGSGYQNMEMWQTSVMGTGSMMGGQSYMSSYQALALETVATPAGNFPNALHVREQRGSGITRDVWYAPGVGMVKMSDGTNTAVLAGYSIPGSAAAPTSFTPVAGVWWDPNQSGSGYGLDYQNGELVVQVYAYLPGGQAQWYLVAGKINANVVTATLDKYTGGQCISCSYMPATMAGNDGNVTITFTSPTTANVALPGGRQAQIQRYFQP